MVYESFAAERSTQLGAFNMPDGDAVQQARASTVPGVLAKSESDIRMPSQGIQPPRQSVAFDPNAENGARMDTNPRLARLMVPQGPSSMG